jgi:hypothetical protein
MVLRYALQSGRSRLSQAKALVSSCRANDKGRHTCRTRGDGREGLTLGTAFFAYKNKKALVKASAKRANLARGGLGPTRLTPAGFESRDSCNLRLIVHLKPIISGRNRCLGRRLLGWTIGGQILYSRESDRGRFVFVITTRTQS